MSSNDSKPGDEDGLEPPPDEVLAGEYVLGVLDAGQRRAVQDRIAADPVFARRVGEWEQRLGSLHASIAPVEVPPQVWQRIRSRLGWQTPTARAGLWHSIGLWRTATALAVAAAIAAFLVGRAPPRVPRQPTAALQPAAGSVTTLARDSGAPGWLASIDVGSGTILLVPVPEPPDPRGRVPELWLIPQGKTPQPLGLLSSSRSHAVIVPAGLRAAIRSGSLLAVSLEPPGGAPHGVPTGPIVAKGIIQL
ncbi:MAG: anti-sigma factor [Gammaproteobacteria bacterium]|nr:anti-sigma factor [Gammaproteobacteria bacterium]